VTVAANDNGLGERPIRAPEWSQAFRARQVGLLWPSYVYVVGFAEFVKIGYTRNFERRHTGLQQGLPVALRTYEVFAGDKRDEGALMAHFAAQSTGIGEWFHRAGPLAERIDAGLPYATFEAATGRKAA
jgi:hypothetical protein